MIPAKSTDMVFDEHPFHSFNMIPQTFEKTTLRAINMQNDRVISVGESVRNPLPSASPKNWLYHSAPARKQNRRLFDNTDVLR